MPTAEKVFGPRKDVDESIAATEETGFKLKKELGRFDLIVFGVAVMVGAGIFALTGEAAATEAGPAITLSFVVAAIVCGLCALSYAELAAMVPVAGSAYTFSYATLGQLIAFIIGWDLVLEFVVGAAGVSVGAAGFINQILDQVFGVTLPEALTAGPFESEVEGGIINLPALIVVLALGTLLYRGVKQTAKATVVLVGITLAVLAVIVVVGAFQVDTANWTPYFPRGFDGVIGGAALVFFAFIGFDVVATVAEESKNPKRDIPQGVLGSLAVVTVIYILVAAVMTGMLVYSDLTGDAPIADAFNATIDSKGLLLVIFAGSLIAVLKTVLGLMLGQTRVAFAMSRDHLLPRKLGETHPRFGTPYRITIITTVAVAIIASLVPLSELAKLVNIGTLFAFILVSAGVLVLRRVDPDRERPFRAPLVPVVPILGILGSLYLASTLERETWERFIIWMLLGFVVYFGWARAQANKSIAEGRGG